MLIMSGGSEAEDSCDHSGAGAPGLLMELRDLEGDVYQRSQHHLDKEITRRTKRIRLPAQVVTFRHFLENVELLMAYHQTFSLSPYTVFIHFIVFVYVILPIRVLFFKTILVNVKYTFYIT